MKKGIKIDLFDILSIIGIISMIVLAIIYKIPVLEMGVGIFGIVSAILNSKGFKFAIFFYGINALWYGTFCIFSQQYGLAIINLLFAFPLYLASVINVYIKKKEDNKELIIKSSPFKYFINCLLIMVLFTLVFASILYYIGSKFAMLNAIAASFCITSTYLASKFHIEQWIFWFGYSISSIIIWLLNIDANNL